MKVLMWVLMGIAAIVGVIAIVSIFIIEDNTGPLTVLISIICLIVLIVGGAGRGSQKGLAATANRHPAGVLVTILATGIGANRHQAALINDDSLVGPM